ncbi:MAG: hypothetical protein QN187_09005 [Armatimonadota bacterium]|nr:hypothetical protein [Armatimonadota bacterium]
MGKPNHRHAFTSTSVTNAVAGSPSHGRARWPRPASASALLTTPKIGLRKSAHRKPTITSDRVTGRKKMTR